MKMNGKKVRPEDEDDVKVTDGLVIGTKPVYKDVDDDENDEYEDDDEIDAADIFIYQSREVLEYFGYDDIAMVIDSYAEITKSEKSKLDVESLENFVKFAVEERLPTDLFDFDVDNVCMTDDKKIFLNYDDGPYDMQITFTDKNMVDLICVDKDEKATIFKATVSRDEVLEFMELIDEKYMEERT